MKVGSIGFVDKLDVRRSVGKKARLPVRVLARAIRVGGWNGCGLRSRPQKAQGLEGSLKHVF